MIGKARQLKQFIKTYNIQDKYGLKNAVNFHVKDEATQQLLKVCVEKNILTAFLKASFNRQQEIKAFCRSQEKVLRSGPNELTAEGAKTAIRYCLYLADVIKDEDIAKREPKKGSPKEPFVEPPQPTVITPVEKEDKPLERPNTFVNLPPIKPIKEDKGDTSLMPQKKKDRQLVKKRKSTRQLKKLPKVIPTNYRERIWNSNLRWLFLLLFIGLLSFGSFKVWNFYKDFTAPKKYCLATGLHIREYPGKDKKSLGGVGFGEELIYYKDVPSNKEQWSEVKARKSGKHGFVNSDYIVSKKYFEELNSILGSDSTFFKIGKTHNRRALKTYFEQNKYCGLMPEDIKVELYNADNLPECYSYWQLFTNNRSSVLTKLDLTGNGKKDFVCILDNARTDAKKLLIITYDKDLNPHYEDRIIIPNSTQNILPIEKVKSNRKRYIGNYRNNGEKLKESLQQDAFYFEHKNDVQGTNETFLIYFNQEDGQFKKYKQ